MKKIGLIVCAAMAAACLTACGGGGNKENNGGNAESSTLKVYNAGEYMDLDLLSEFEDEYNCKVVYETFESNEMMYTKLSSGEVYDIIIPSDYMIERLMKEDRLRAIDWSLITNKDNLLPEVMGQAYDPNNEYSVPYFWGTVGIIYNKEKVDVADLEAEGWNVLQNEKYKGHIYMYDSERDSFMIALKALGYSMNTRDENEIKDAFDWLIKQQETMSPIYVGDDVIDNMISENKDMAIVYSGDAAYMISENENLDYYTPSEGTNVWYDAMVITKDCQNLDLAHAFIDFMLDEENALANTEEVGYTSTVKSAYEEMQKTTYEGISAYVPPIDNPKNEVFRYQEDELRKIFADYWVKVKAN